MSSFLNNFLKIQNIGLFFLLLTPISFIIGSLIANIFTILLFIIYVFYQPKKEIYNFIKKYKYLIISLFSFIILNIINSEAREYSLSKVLPYFRFFIFFISIFFILNSVSKNIYLYTKILLILTLFLIFDFYFQLYFGKNIFGFPYNQDYGRITGAFGDEMIIGNFLLYFGFLSIAFVNYFYEINNFNNFILFLILSITILMSGERTPFISLIYLFLFIFLFSNKKKFIFLLSISVIILSTVFINFSDRLANKYPIRITLNLSEEMKIISEDNDKSNSERTISTNNVHASIHIFKKYKGHYSRAIDIFKKNYILGSGFRSYRKICGTYETMKQPSQYETDKERRLTCSIHPHNYHLEILSETGIIGYLIFLSFIVYICFLFFKKKLYNNFPASILFGLIITYIFPFKPTGSFFSTNSAFIFWFLIAHFLYFSNLFDKKSNFSKQYSLNKNNKR